MATRKRPASRFAICVDNAEMVEARWFTAADIRRRRDEWPNGGPFRVDSIGKVLVQGWLAEQE